MTGLAWLCVGITIGMLVGIGAVLFHNIREGKEARERMEAWIMHPNDWCTNFCRLNNEIFDEYKEDLDQARDILISNCCHDCPVSSAQNLLWEERKTIDE